LRVNGTGSQRVAANGRKSGLNGRNGGLEGGGGLGWEGFVLGKEYRFEDGVSVEGKIQGANGKKIAEVGRFWRAILATERWVTVLGHEVYRLPRSLHCAARRVRS
jgi:hypothetical protein